MEIKSVVIDALDIEVGATTTTRIYVVTVNYGDRTESWAMSTKQEVIAFRDGVHAMIPKRPGHTLPVFEFPSKAVRLVNMAMYRENHDDYIPYPKVDEPTCPACAGLMIKNKSNPCYTCSNCGEKSGKSGKL